MSISPSAEITDDEIRASMKTPDGRKELLGKSMGVAYRMSGFIEIPQDLYEFGFIEHRTARLGSEYARPYDEVIFDTHPTLKGRKVEL